MTTPDPATLREALAAARESWGVNYENSRIIIAAARWALDLIEGGKEVWWCDDPGGEGEPGILAEPCAGGDGCGKRLLVEP